MISFRAPNVVGVAVVFLCSLTALSVNAQSLVDCRDVRSDCTPPDANNGTLCTSYVKASVDVLETLREQPLSTTPGTGQLKNNPNTGPGLLKTSPDGALVCVGGIWANGVPFDGELLAFACGDLENGGPGCQCYGCVGDSYAFDNSWLALRSTSCNSCQGSEEDPFVAIRDGEQSFTSTTDDGPHNLCTNAPNFARFQEGAPSVRVCEAGKYALPGRLLDLIYNSDDTSETFQGCFDPQTTFGPPGSESPFGCRACPPFSIPGTTEGSGCSCPADSTFKLGSWVEDADGTKGFDFSCECDVQDATIDTSLDPPACVCPPGLNAFEGKCQDTTPPTVTLTTSSPATTNESPIVFTATFSEPVTLDALLISVTFPSGVNVAITPDPADGAAMEFTITVSGFGAGVAGDLEVQLLVGAATDLNGNESPASDIVTVNFDSVAPTLEFAGPGPNNEFVATFLEDVTGFDTSDVQLVFTGDLAVDPNARDPAVIVTGELREYLVTINVDSLSGSGTVGVFVGDGAAQDLAGNPSVAQSSSNTITVGGNEQEDTDPPVIECPDDVVVVANNEWGFKKLRYETLFSTWPPTVSDNVDGAGCCQNNLAINIPTKSTFGLGPTTVQLTTTDSAGNVGTCSFEVFVRCSFPAEDDNDDTDNDDADDSDGPESTRAPDVFICKGQTNHWSRKRTDVRKVCGLNEVPAELIPEGVTQETLDDGSCKYTIGESSHKKKRADLYPGFPGDSNYPALSCRCRDSKKSNGWGWWAGGGFTLCAVGTGFVVRRWRKRRYTPQTERTAGPVHIFLDNVSQDQLAEVSPEDALFSTRSTE